MVGVSSRTSLLTSLLAVALAVPLVPSAAAAPVVVFQDDFEDGAIDASDWPSTSGVEESAVCGAHDSSRALHFIGSAVRQATTKTLDVSDGGQVSFWLKSGIEDTVPLSCDPPNTAGEELVLEYSINGGGAWALINTYLYPDSPDFVQVTEQVPAAATTSSTMFRWKQLGHNGGTNDAWSLDDVAITTGPPAPPPAPVSQSIPGESISEGIPSQSIDTPPATTPATCTLGPCTQEGSIDTPPVPIVTPDVPVVVPDTPVPRTCTPLDVVCVGPFVVPGASETIPGQDESIPGQHVADVPPICDVANVACFDPQTIPGQHLGDTAPATVSVDFTGLDATADPNAGELTSIGPFHIDVGPIPVDVCASTCPFPVTPEGETEGSLTVTVTIGSEEFSQTIPLGL